MSAKSPPEQPRQPRRPVGKLPWILAIVGAFVVGCVFGGVVGAIGGAAAGSIAAAGSADAPTAAAVADPSSGVASEQPSDVPFEYTTDQFTVKLKTKRKQCFGSAGCNVTVVPVLSVDDASLIPSDAAGELTIEITGDESGPITQTLDLTGTQYNQEETTLSTSGSSTKVKVKITDVETS